MRLRFTLLALVFILTVPSALGQQWRRARFETFGGVTLNQYFGDIGGAATETNLLGILDFSFAKLRPGICVGARYQISQQFRVRASYSLGMLAKSDAGSRNEGRRYAFRGHFHELAVKGEFFLIPEHDRNFFFTIMELRGGLRRFRQPWSMYVFLGAGGIYHSATPLERLATSPRFYGGNDFAWVLPGGLGARYAFAPRLSLGVELGGRFVFSDRLDGVSPAASRHNDVYYTLGVVLNYKIATPHRRPLGLPRRRGWFF